MISGNVLLLKGIEQERRKIKFDSDILFSVGSEV